MDLSTTQIVEMTTKIANLSQEVERLRAERDEQKRIAQGYYSEAAQGWGKFREAEQRLATAQARITRLEAALGNITEYWNGNPNQRAMVDALDHILIVAEQALAKETP